MIYTNKYGLCSELYEAIVNRQKRYDKGEADFSATELIDPPRIVQLTRRHYDEIEVDITSLLESWKGHLVHDALERPQTSNRLYCKIGASVICGAYDYYLDGVLKDYKTVSVWGTIVGNPQKKWREQLGVYQYLLQYHRLPVDKMVIEAIFKDWSETDLKRQGHSYPAKPVMSYSLAPYESQEVFDLIHSRVGIHERAMMMMDNELPECTLDEMWAKPTTFAVVKEGQTRAQRVFADIEEAESFAKGRSDFSMLSIDVRMGERTRCEKYCDVKPFCSQYKEYSNARIK